MLTHIIKSLRRASQRKGSGPEMESEIEKSRRLKFAGSQLRDSFDNFAEETTLHGMKNVCGPSHIFRKLIWIILLLGMTVTYLYIGSISLMKYFSHDSMTRITTRSVSKLDFPAVSICDQNVFSEEVLSSYEGLTDIVPTFHLDDWDTLSQEQLDNASKILNDVLIYDLVLGSSPRHFVEERMFVSCKFGGVSFPCTEYFRFQMTESAPCYTFQAESWLEDDNAEHTVQYSEKPGFRHGLDIILDIHADDPLVTVANGLGITVVIHDPYVYPRIEEQAFAIKPGVEAYVAIEQITRKDLGPPYSNIECHKENDTFHFPHVGQKEYNFEGCMLNCMYETAFMSCDCEFDSHDSCNMVEYYFCIRPQYEEYYKKGCGCLHPCKSTTYDYRVSTLRYPSPMVLHQANISGWEQNTEEGIHKNMLQMYVYYKSMQKTIIEQIPAYDLDELIANIGGQLGLFLGASIITIVEMVEFILIIIFKQCFRLGEKNLQPAPSPVNKDFKEDLHYIKDFKKY